MAQLRKIMKRKSIYLDFKKVYVSSSKLSGEERNFTIHLKNEIDEKENHNIVLNRQEVENIIDFFKTYIENKNL
jgi:predicted protein tyrosine phosphatase